MQYEKPIISTLGTNIGSGESILLTDLVDFNTDIDPRKVFPPSLAAVSLAMQQGGGVGQPPIMA